MLLVYIGVEKLTVLVAVNCGTVEETRNELISHGNESIDLCNTLKSDILRDTSQTVDKICLSFLLSRFIRYITRPKSVAYFLRSMGTYRSSCDEYTYAAPLNGTFSATPHKPLTKYVCPFFFIMLHSVHKTSKECCLLLA